MIYYITLHILVLLFFIARDTFLRVLWARLRRGLAHSISIALHISVQFFYWQGLFPFSGSESSITMGFDSHDLISLSLYYFSSNFYAIECLLSRVLSARSQRNLAFSTWFSMASFRMWFVWNLEPDYETTMTVEIGTNRLCFNNWSWIFLIWYLKNFFL